MNALWVLPLKNDFLMCLTRESARNRDCRAGKLIFLWAIDSSPRHPLFMLMLFVQETHLIKPRTPPLHQSIHPFISFCSPSGELSSYFGPAEVRPPTTTMMTKKSAAPSGDHSLWFSFDPEVLKFIQSRPSDGPESLLSLVHEIPQSLPWHLNEAQSYLHKQVSL